MNIGDAPHDFVPPVVLEFDPDPALAPKRKRSGTRWTEQDFAEHGYRTIKVRVRREVAERFEALAQKLGATQAATIEALLEGTDEPESP